MAAVYGHGEYGKAAGMAADSYALFMVLGPANLPPSSPPTPLDLAPPTSRDQGAEARTRDEARGVSVRLGVLVYQGRVLVKVWLREKGASVYRG